MANMGYCRFNNTLDDLEDCYDHMSDRDLSEHEDGKRKKLIELCKLIADEYGDDD